MRKIVGEGIYSFPEAARLTGLKTRRVRRWFGADGRDATFLATYQTKRGKAAISFLDLIDVLIAGKLRDKGVPYSVLRRSYLNLRDKFDTPHAFCFRDIWTDGRKVFLQHLSDAGEERLVDMEHRQHVLSNVLRPYLDKIIHDPHTLLASRWEISEGVIVDPNLNYGWPTISANGLSTHLLAAEYAANNKDADKISSIYDVARESVLLAVDFQRSLNDGSPGQKSRAA